MHNILYEKLIVNHFLPSVFEMKPYPNPTKYKDSITLDSIKLDELYKVDIIKDGDEYVLLLINKYGSTKIAYKNNDLNFTPLFAFLYLTINTNHIINDMLLDSIEMNLGTGVNRLICEAITSNNKDIVTNDVFSFVNNVKFYIRENVIDSISELINKQKNISETTSTILSREVGSMDSTYDYIKNLTHDNLTEIKETIRLNALSGLLKGFNTLLKHYLTDKIYLEQNEDNFISHILKQLEDSGHDLCELNGRNQLFKNFKKFTMEHPNFTIKEFNTMIIYAKVVTGKY